MFEKIIECIEKYDSIVIFGHKNPDGDCYGSAQGLKRTLSLKYPKKKIYVTGNGIAKYFKIIDRMDNVSDKVIKESLAILVDMNDLERSEDQRIYNCKAFCKIDHHVDTGSFTEGPQVVIEGANSTCDIVVGMIQECQLPVDDKVANALYLGILTDSSRFQFVSDYPTTYDRVAFLCRKGANPKMINSVLAMSTENELRCKAYVLSHYQKTKNGVLYIVFSKETLKELNLHANMASGLINLIGNIEGYPVWASFAEYEDGKVRMELRSNGPAVQPIALTVGGGGHRNAAGGTLQKYDEAEIARIVGLLDEAAKEYKKGKK